MKESAKKHRKFLIVGSIVVLLLLGIVFELQGQEIS